MHKKITLLAIPILFLLSAGLQPFTIKANTPTKPQTLLINEIMPNPAGSDNDYEWIELHNNDNVTVRLSDYYIDSKQLPDLLISPGGILVFARNPQQLAQIRPGIELHEFSFNLGNSGGTLTLTNQSEIIIQEFRYETSTDDTSWQLLSGSCFEIVATTNHDTIGQVNVPCIGTTYQSSPTILPLPTNAESTLKITPTTVKTDTIQRSTGTYLIGITALLPNPQSGEREWVEITNFSDQSIDLNNWQLSDKSEKSHKLTGMLMAGEAIRIFPESISLNNSDEIIILKNNYDEQIDVISYLTTSKGVILKLSEETDRNEAYKVIPPENNYINYIPQTGEPHQSLSLPESDVKIVIKLQIPKLYRIN